MWRRCSPPRAAARLYSGLAGALIDSEAEAVVVLDAPLAAPHAPPLALGEPRKTRVAVELALDLRRVHALGERQGVAIYGGETSVARMARRFEELIDWLGRDNCFPSGVILLTGTGIVPPDDAVGCLQDIHWPDGAWGYFPTYTLGAMAAAQLFAAARRAVPDLMNSIGRGEFAQLLGWLRQNVHSRGSISNTDHILSEATGALLGAASFKAHLESRYLPA